MAQFSIDDSWKFSLDLCYYHFLMLAGHFGIRGKSSKYIKCLQVWWSRECDFRTPVVGEVAMAEMPEVREVNQAQADMEHHPNHATGRCALSASHGALCLREHLTCFAAHIWGKGTHVEFSWRQEV